MLQVIDKKKAKTTYDRTVKNMVIKACRLWDTLDDFERVFKYNLGCIQRLNTVIAKNSYCLIEQSANVIEVWHLNSQGDQDRLLQEVIYKPETL